MNSKIAIAFLAVLGLTGCVVYDYGGGSPPPPQAPARSGDVTFTWHFAGRTCGEVPQVRSVVVNIPGERLQNNGVYPCLANNYPGIVLHDFGPGTYRFDIEAVGYGNERLYAGSGTFTVNGDVRVNIDLTPAGGPNSYAYLTWRFPANSVSQNPTCDQAGAASVEVRIDAAQVVRFPCASGFTQTGAQTPFIAAGTHAVEFTARSSDGYPFYRFLGSLQTFAGAPVSVEYKLGWAVGGTAVRWQLTNGSVGQSCAQAGIQMMNINFQDSAGNLLYGSAGDNQACAAAPVVYNYLRPGTYRVFIKGTGSGGVVYLSNAQNPPLVTVRAGEFVTSQQATAVQLFRAQ